MTLLGLAHGLPYNSWCLHAGACLGHVPPLPGALPGPFLPALPPALPLLGTLLVVAVIVLSKLVEKKVRLLVVAVRGCE